ncbi:efflux RND transporter permease subunit [Halovulum sp. GXIMD14794]
MARGIERAKGILSYFTRHNTAANLILVLMVAFGIVAATQIRSQFFPDVVLERIRVQIAWEGAGPEDVDNAIIGVLEPALLVVEGVTEAESTAREGRAEVELFFEPDWDMASALDEVVAAVDSVNNLPEGAEEPDIQRARWRDRVTDVVISGPVSPEQLGRYADEFVQRLFREGITRTTIRGVAAPKIEVTVPEAALVRHDVSLQQIADAIGAEAQADPAGEVSGGSTRVRTGVEKRTAEEVAAVEVRSDRQGERLTVGDLAQVTQRGADSGRAYFKGEYPAVSIRVDRNDQGDAIAMQAAVSRVAAELQPLLPDGVRVELIRTRAEAITDRLDILLDNGLVGLGLVLALLFLFLSARIAFWVAAGIPVAMFAAIALMYAFGLTINMISLFALIICLGIVVDDAIVVGEHADFRHRRLGEGPAEASENAARRMFLPVFSATITTVLAFIGLTTISGRFGELVADIPFTVVMVLIASLAECFLILPNHMSHALAAQDRGRAWYDWPSRTVNAGFRYVRHYAFRPLMAVVIRLRYPMLAGALVVLALALSAFLRGDVTWRFFNAPEQPSISGNIAMLPGATRDDTLAMIRELQRATDAVAARYEDEHGTNPVTFALAEVGGTTGRGLAGSDTKDEDQLGSIAIELIDPDFRPYSSFEFLGALQDEVVRHPMLETLSFRGWRSGPGGDALDVQLFGAEAAVLKQASEELKLAVARFPEVSAVEDNLAYDKTEMVLELTPLGTALGFSIDTVGRELRQRLNGIEAAEFPVGTRTGSIEVGLPEGELTADFLTRTRLRAPDGAWVQLSDIVSVSERLGFSTVRRENGLRVLNVTGDISEDDPERAAAITEELRTAILPDLAARHGVEWRLAGLAEQESDFLSEALLGFMLCLLGIYLTLSWIFASWTRPLVVMSVIPFGLIGVIYGHWQWDVPISMFSVVGLIGMTGIIINDSIVLVTTVDDYARDRALVPALIDAAADRLRPILLTTLTTVLGLAPLLYESSQQAQFLKPTVITLSYGLGVGMVLVLLLVPALIASQQDVGRILRSLRRARAGRGQPVAARLVLAGAATASLGVVAVTAGYWAATGRASGPVEALLPGLPGGPASIAAMLVGLFAVFVSAWVLVALTGAGRRAA